MSHRWVWSCGFGNQRFKSDRWVCADCHKISEGHEKGWTGDLLSEQAACLEPKHPVDPAVFQPPQPPQSQ